MGLLNLGVPRDHFPAGLQLQGIICHFPFSVTTQLGGETSVCFPPWLLTLDMGGGGEHRQILHLACSGI